MVLRRPNPHTLEFNSSVQKIIVALYLALPVTQKLYMIWFKNEQDMPCQREGVNVFKKTLPIQFVIFEPTI
jgi:hypothetical protein